MMEAIKIVLYNKHLGDVYLDARNSIVFKYTLEFLNSNLNPSPFSLEKTNAEYRFMGRDFRHFYHLPGMLADSLPDKFGSDLLLSYLKTIGRDESSLNALERLSYAGNRSIGALEYMPSHIPSIGNLSDKVIDLDFLVKIADQVLNNKLQLDISIGDNNMLEQIIGVGTSAGGARAKAIIARNVEGHIISGASNIVPNGYRHEIIKLEGELTKDYGRTEYTYYQIAKKAGINMMPSELIEDGRYAHFVTQRFDRTSTGEKIHTQTLAALQHLDFNTDTYSYEGILNMITILNGNRNQSEDLFRRMVFNVISCNRDDHAKNTSFMMDNKGVWSITPAYDLCYTYTEQIGTWSNVHHTSVNQKITNITEKDFLIIANEYDVESPKEIIQEVLDAFSSFPTIARRNGIGKDKINLILKNTNLIFQGLNIQNNSNLKNKI